MDAALQRQRPVLPGEAGPSWRGIPAHPARPALAPASSNTSAVSPDRSTSPERQLLPATAPCKPGLPPPVRAPWPSAAGTCRRSEPPTTFLAPAQSRRAALPNLRRRRGCQSRVVRRIRPRPRHPSGPYPFEGYKNPQTGDAGLCGDCGMLGPTAQKIGPQSHKSKASRNYDGWAAADEQV